MERRAYVSSVCDALCRYLTSVRAHDGAAHRLDVHILDYLKKRNLPETAAAFQNECHISEKPRGAGENSSVAAATCKAFNSPACHMLSAAIDVTSGFLYEWWSIFWDIYVARSNPSYSQYANTYAQVGLSNYLCLGLIIHLLTCLQASVCSAGSESQAIAVSTAANAATATAHAAAADCTAAGMQFCGTPCGRPEVAIK